MCWFSPEEMERFAMHCDLRRLTFGELFPWEPGEGTFGDNGMWFPRKLLTSLWLVISHERR